jgi:hypothetical protein
VVFKGVVYDINQKDFFTQLVFKKKVKDRFGFVCYSAYGEQSKRIAELNIEKGDEVRLEYELFSKKHLENYYTTAVVQEIQLVSKSLKSLFENIP